MVLVAAAFVKDEVAVVEQPAVEVDPAAERAESVVGDDHQHRVVAVALRDRLADEVVHAAVEVADDVAAVEDALFGPGGVAIVDVAPEGVLETVGAVEDADDQPARDLVDRVEEHRLALAVGVEALLDELVVVDDVLVQRPGVLGEAERREGPLFLRQVLREDGRISDRHRGLLGVDVDGRDVEAEFGLGVQEQELADPVHLDPRRDPEADANPVGVLPLLQFICRAVDLDPRAAGRGDR